VQLVCKALQAPLVLRVRPEPKAQQALLGARVHPVRLVCKALRERRDQLAQLGAKVLQVPLVQSGLRALKVWLAHPVR